MRFTEFKGYVPAKRSYSKVKGELMEFINMNVECVKVTWTKNEYESINSCYNALHKSARRNFPEQIRVTKYNGDIYLIRKDI